MINVIPFTLDCPFDIEKPVFKITINNIKYFFFNREMLISFDTGASNTYLYNSGEKKIWGSIEKFYEDWAYPIYEKETKNLENKLPFNELYKNKCVISKYWNFKLNKQQKIKNKIVYCSCYSRLDIDMLVGQDLFSEHYKNIIIDYRKNEIILNGSYINNTPIPMRKGFNGIYIIPITINGIQDEGIIDTGCSGFILREGYEKRREVPLDENKILSNTYNGTVEIPVLQEETIEVEDLSIGNINFKSLLALKYNDKRILEYKEILKYMNILGNYIWEGHRIQLDFEHNEFRID